MINVSMVLGIRELQNKTIFELKHESISKSFNKKLQ